MPFLTFSDAFMKYSFSIDLENYNFNEIVGQARVFQKNYNIFSMEVISIFILPV